MQETENIKTENSSEINTASPEKIKKASVLKNEGDVCIISYAPHIWRGFSTAKIMYIFLASLILPSAAAVYYFGLRALWIMIACTATSLIVEFAIKKLRKKKFAMDGTALITGLLLALTLPPRMPIWMAVIGAAFSIAIAKEVFGGLGYNIFNPALAGRAFLAICFSQQTTSWYMPFDFRVDAVTSATPLGEAFVFEGSKLELYKSLFFGNRSGSMGETSIMLILIACIILIALKVVDWRIPVVYIGVVAIMSLIFGEDILFQVLAGGLFFGAVFMATDYVTSPLYWPGKIIFAAGCGLLTFLIRKFGAMPEGVCFSILIMNAFVPLIDKYVRPRPFGFVKPAREKKAA